MKGKRYLTIAIVVMLTALAGGWNLFFRLPNPIDIKMKSSSPVEKPVILLMIDSLMHKPLQEVIRDGRAPALAFLLKHGRYFPKMVSSFPTMSVTIDATLLTGTYPDLHRVPGLVWYDAAENRIVNYGSGGIRETLKTGLGQMLYDSLYNLNNVHLSRNVKTIHEELAAKGKASASVNALIYRGKTPHILHTSAMIPVDKTFPARLKTFGPEWFSLGVLSQIEPDSRYHHAWKKFGFNNKFAADEIKYLIQKRKLPAFTIAYFPELDQAIHKKGITVTREIERADRQIQEIFAAYGSWETALKEAIWIVMGDSGQTSIGGERKEALIDLPSLLSSYRIAEEGKPARKTDQIVLGFNERMAYVYALDERLSLSEIARSLQKDKRIDVIAWKEGSFIRIVNGGKEGDFFYRRNGRYIDTYGQTWSMQGDASVLDLSVTGNRIAYGSYPDGLARLYGALHSHPGRYLILTARPGCELTGPSIHTHINGAGHGSLHEQDSLVPLIVSGTDLSPKHLRIVDMKDWILRLIR
ncbi:MULTISPECIES: alkaline phosphatase family protein [Aneurinibacillus]|uniref:Alkaline phosphatase family protein n=1 Tax=Aneurinibacillus thermoaerophilus TaxID=143495 RepID=A0ABX8Y7G3_ANETH|nr:MULTISPECIES: alkaline phosphatase family protein [Aneurinibacillus]AMA72994.1 phosphodiesterase [Aneurinibacillus sp. XH2]MED0677783.1 alkaline phosphatase family protein [Aneurinibacillus thermoaerophilus]MED0737532.1 alkaline phosphatase family protein [Aneurinibacillus thermoaerophilus]MED0758103.1 alkaline phosphatase family protein [Aneurinibacillus thermoaerophilus]MED0761257.1 alkaline phosphatase family protein [Aneurinibacillus thermoaerophilus]